MVDASRDDEPQLQKMSLDLLNSVCKMEMEYKVGFLGQDKWSRLLDRAKLHLINLVHNSETAIVEKAIVLLQRLIELSGYLEREQTMSPEMQF